MATTKIKAIYSSAGACLDYVMNDKSHGGAVRGSEFEFDENVGNLIAYATNDKTGEVTYKTLTTRHNCIPGAEWESFNRDMSSGMGAHYKGNRTKNGQMVAAYHLIQSFDGHETDPRTANEIGLKLAREIFGNHAVTVSTHTNTGNVHNHIVICAWDKDGYKYHDCYDTYRQIRRVSDRLCEEHGLSVLEDTRDMKMKRYESMDGTTHHAEVTPRKIEAWSRYDKGINPISKPSDYRSSDAYKSLAAYKESNRQSIKEDIDGLLHHVSSYGELLIRLRDMGYEIKDTRADGSWREHVTFKAPGQQKGTRDYKIGDGMFYTRECLDAHISGLVALRTEDKRQYVEDAREESSAAGRNSGNYSVEYHTADSGMFIEHSPANKVVSDMREARVEIDRVSPDKSVRNEVYVEQLRRQISDNIKVLSFIEDKKLHSYSQINGLYKSAYDLYNRVSGELKILDREVSRLEKLMMLPQTIKVMEIRLSNEVAKYENIGAEIALLAQFKEISGKYAMNFPRSKTAGYRQRTTRLISRRRAARNQTENSLNTPEGMEKLSRDIENVKNRIAGLKPVIEQGKAELAKYELCMKTLDRIDRKNGIRDEQAMREHYQIKAQGRSVERGGREREHER